jgi:chromosome segregation ATPase
MPPSASLRGNRREIRFWSSLAFNERTEGKLEASGRKPMKRLGLGLLVLIALVATGGAIWSYLKYRDALQDLKGAESFRSMMQIDAKAASKRATDAERDKAAAEQSGAEIRAQLTEAQKAKDAAEGSLKKTTDELAATKTAHEAAESELREAKTQVSELQAAKEAAEREAAKAKEELAQERAAHQSAAPVGPEATPQPPSQ